MTALRLRKITKRYGAATVLDGVDLDIHAGEIHALVGENGAGKSTLLGILAGRVVPTEGMAELFDAPLPTGDPRAARGAGVVAIYQELTIVPASTAMANVFLGAPTARCGWLQRRAMARRFTRLARRLGAHIDPQARASTLSVADQQLLEVMRALHAEARVMLFDEPTAPLAPAERQALLRVMADLRAQGVTMLFVSHQLDEVLRIADRVSVFRDGRLVETRETPAWTRLELIGAMLGPVGGALADPPARARAAGRPVLEVEHLSVPGVLGDVSFEVRANEIVGLAGLIGSGRSTLLRALAGLEPAATGRVTVNGCTAPPPRTVREALERGLALIPEDRKAEGLVPQLSAARNITLSNPVRRRRAHAEAAATPFGFDARRLDAPVAHLSGGNQQKILLARWAHRRPAVLLADEPTRGIDVGAKAQILHALRAFAAVLMVSSEQEELLATADRILVLAHGRLVAELDDHAGENDILTAAFDLEPAHVRT